ncbi:MAG: phosphatase PAP2 family protein [Treponema sp.]|nr:phosphatase PAP2 family protein [Treponema sp.]
MDISYLLFLQRLRAALPPFWEKFFNTVSVWDLSIYAVLFIPCLLYWCLDKSLGQRVMFSYIGARFINAVLKLTVCCYRPWIRDSRVVPAPAALGGAGGYSFPSGHSSSGMGLFGSAGWVLRRRFYGLLTAALWVFIALVLFSRNFLGVHTPQDVIVGAAVGMLAIWLAGCFLDWEGRLDEGAAKGVGGIGKNALDKGGSDRTGINNSAGAKSGDFGRLGPGKIPTDVLVLVAALAVCAVTLAYFVAKPYPVDYVDGKVLVDPLAMQLSSLKQVGELAGLFLGWFIERRFIRFSTDCSVPEKLVRLAVCGTGLLWESRHVPRMVRAVFGARGAVIVIQFIFVFYIMCVAPLLCRLLHRAFVSLGTLFSRGRKLGG